MMRLRTTAVMRFAPAGRFEAGATVCFVTAFAPLKRIESKTGTAKAAPPREGSQTVA